MEQYKGRPLCLVSLSVVSVTVVNHGLKIWHEKFQKKMPKFWIVRHSEWSDEISRCPSPSPRVVNHPFVRGMEAAYPPLVPGSHRSHHIDYGGNSRLGFKEPFFNLRMAPPHRNSAAGNLGMPTRSQKCFKVESSGPNDSILSAYIIPTRVSTTQEDILRDRDHIHINFNKYIVIIILCYY